MSPGAGRGAPPGPERAGWYRPHSGRPNCASFQPRPAPCQQAVGAQPWKLRESAGMEGVWGKRITCVLRPTGLGRRQGDLTRNDLPTSGFAHAASLAPGAPLSQYQPGVPEQWVDTGVPRAQPCTSDKKALPGALLLPWPLAGVNFSRLERALQGLLRKGGRDGPWITLD